MRRGTVVIPVNRMAEGEGSAPVKLPFFSAALSVLDSVWLFQLDASLQRVRT